MRRRSPKAYRARAIARFDPNRVQGLVHCSPHEFNDLMEELLYLKAKLRSTARHMKFKDKLFLVFIWIMHYPAYSLLSHIFGVSQRTVSTLITVLLPLLVEFFVSFIPETLEDDARCSVLSNFIVAIVDSTIHPTRKPSSGQHLYWNGHYKTHGILTHLLIDFNGYIISATTNIKGDPHDGNAAHFLDPFVKILGQRFALSDPGFNGADWAVLS
jgi:hypothetical protein